MLSEEKIFFDYIKHHGLRHSAQRERVFKAYLDLEGHFDFAALFDASREIDHGIAIATVYRTIHLLKDCGLVQAHSLPGGKKVFEKKYQKAHHDHMLCTQCGAFEEFAHPMIEKYQIDVARKHEFQLDSHQMILFGICKNCGES